MSTEFIPDEAREETAAASAAAEQKYAPIEDGYYWCRPIKVVDSKEDGTPLDDTNINIRVWFKAIETAPLGGDPMPVANNVEAASDTITLVYGAGGKVWDIKKSAWRPATDADTEETIAKMARIFPEWAAFETDDPSEKLAWFITHFEEFAKCRCLCKIRHSVSRADGKTYANARLVERKAAEANIKAIETKLTRSHKAILGKFMVKPETAKKEEVTVKGESEVAPTPAPAAEMPPEAPGEGDATDTSKTDCWQYYCKNHPDHGKTTGGWHNVIAKVAKERGKTSEGQFGSADWKRVMDAMWAEWPEF